MIAVVTGAGRGIGRAIALELADRGCDVALLGRQQDALASAAAEIVHRGRRALALPCDVARSDEVEAAASRVLVDLGVPRFVVSNAGVAHRTSVLDTTEEQWDEVLDVNLK